MSLGSKGRRRSRAAIDRRFTIARVGGDALRFAMRPKSILFLGFIGLLSFTGEPLVRYFSHHPYFAIREVVISGTERLDEARVRSWLGMVEGKSIWQATPKDLEEVLRQRAVVADAHVRRRLPDRIEIVVEERQAGAIVRDARGFFLADDEGVLFEEAPLSEVAGTVLPIVTVARSVSRTAPEVSVVGEGRGPGATDDTLGDARVLPPRQLAEAISLATRLEGGDGGVEVSEVTIRPDRSGESAPDLYAHSIDGQLSVRLGWGGWDAKLGSLSRVVAHARRDGRAGEDGLSGTVDVRDPEAVVARWSEGEAA